MPWSSCPKPERTWMFARWTPRLLSTWRNGRIAWRSGDTGCDQAQRRLGPDRATRRPPMLLATDMKMGQKRGCRGGVLQSSRSWTARPAMWQCKPRRRRRSDIRAPEAVAGLPPEPATRGERGDEARVAASLAARAVLAKHLIGLPALHDRVVAGPVLNRAGRRRRVADVQHSIRQRRPADVSTTLLQVTATGVVAYCPASAGRAPDDVTPAVNVDGIGFGAVFSGSMALPQPASRCTSASG